MRILILLLLANVALGAEPSLRHEYNIIFPAAVHPEQYAGRTTGHFGRKFVGAAKRRFFAVPSVPKRILGRSEPGVVKAALLIDKDGDVKEVAIIDQAPGDLVDDTLLEYLHKRIGFVPIKEGKKAVEYETEVVIAFRPAAPKKG